MSSRPVSTVRPDRLKTRQRRSGQVLHDVQVVDHEIEDDADVDGAEAKRAEAVALHEPGLEVVPAQGEKGGIEALDVADLQDSAVPPRQRRQGRGVIHVGSQRLFDEHSRALLKEEPGHDAVILGGHRDADGIDAPNKGLIIGVPRNAILASYRLGARGIRIDHRHQVSVREFGVNPRMMLTEVADADDGGADFLPPLGNNHANHPGGSGA